MAESLFIRADEVIRLLGFPNRKLIELSRDSMMRWLLKDIICLNKQEQTKVNGVMNAQDKITRFLYNLAHKMRTKQTPCRCK